MKSRAAIALKAGSKLFIDEVDISGPQDDEYLVEIRTTGICLTNLFPFRHRP